MEGNVATVYVGFSDVYLENPSVKFKLPKLEKGDFYVAYSNEGKSQIAIILFPCGTMSFEGNSVRRQKTWKL